MYIPYAQRNSPTATTGGYIPYAQRLAEEEKKKNAPKKYTPEQTIELQRIANGEDIGSFTKFARSTPMRFLEELPGAVTQTVGGFFRGGMSVGKQIIDTVRGDENRGKAQIETFTPKSTIGKSISESLFGKEEVDIPNIPQYGKEFKQSFGLEGGNEASNVVLGGVLATLDFTTGGAGDDAIEAIAKSKSPQAIKQILRDIGVLDELIEVAAPKLAKISDPVVIKQAIESMAETQQTSKAVIKPITANRISESPLLQEARKFRTADEFVKAQGDTVYRGGDTTIDTTKGSGKGISVSDKQTADLFKAPEGGVVSEAVLPKSSKILREADIPKNLQDAYINEAKVLADPNNFSSRLQKSVIDKQQAIIDYARKNGFDAVEFPFEKEIRIVKSDVLKTKSQLTDIWKEANSVDALRAEAQAKGLPELPKVRKSPVKLEKKIETVDTELEKIEMKRASAPDRTFSPDMEDQYKSFKKFLSPSELDSVEDVAQLKKKYTKRAEKRGVKIDDFLWSQKDTGDDMFTKFKDRRFAEIEDRPKMRQLNEKATALMKEQKKLSKISKDRTAKKELVDKYQGKYEQGRRTFIKAIQKQFGLSDSDLRSITNRDYRLMSEAEFSKHLDNIKIKATALEEKRQALNQVEDLITRKELKKTENLQQAMKLPPIRKMSVEQLAEFEKTLEKFKTGDEFLSVRKLETVDNTDLKGIRTLREAKEKLALEVGKDVSELDNIKVGAFDRYSYDTALAEKNPFYSLMVDTVNKSVLNGEARFLKVEERINKLLSKARKTRKLSLKEKIIDKFVPQDKKIFKWLETPDNKKHLIDLSNDELEAAQYIRQQYARMRDYLVQHNTLKKYRSDYITHIRRGFLEEWKEDGLLNAAKNVFKQYQDDEAIFNIIDDTGQILPLEKFFKFSLKRTGGLKPTENVAEAFLSYAKAFEKKAALDSIVPKLDIYAHSLTPKKLTPRGLEFDRSLKTFVNEWVNTKKGRTAKIVGIEQGGKVDLLLRAGKAFTSMLDLGLNIPVGLSARAGENMTNFVQMGTKNYAKGLVRARTSQGKAIAKQYKNFIGRTPFDEFFDVRKNVTDKLFEAAFGLFKDATVRSNKTFLLGSLTDEEFKSGKLSAKRLAELKREMGRYRVVEGAKSIVGSTSLGGVFTQYKSWAIPPLITVKNNLISIYKNPALIKKREGQELLRATLGTFMVVMVGKAFIGDRKDKGFLNTLLNKAYRDSLTISGALNPMTMAGVPRLSTFVADLAKSIDDIIKLEGFSQTKKTLMPRIIKQFVPTAGNKKTEKKESPFSATLPEIEKPELPKLPPLPKIKN